MNSSQPYRRVHVMQSSESLVSTAGGALLVETVRATGVGRGLSRALRGWMSPTAVHDPGKVLLDLAVSIGLGGDCLADVAVVRAQRDLFGPVASDPTVSRLIDRLGTDVDVALDRLRVARAAARAAAWAHRSPVPATGLVPVDPDGSLVLAHSEKEQAAPTFKRTYGHHPLLAFVDHTGAGDGGGGEPLAAMLRPGSANANDAADHITVLDLALAQLSEQVRARVLVRAERGGGTKAFLAHIVGLGLQYSVGIGTKTDADGWQITVFATNTPAGGLGTQLADLELTHRLRARCEDRIRVLKDSGLRNLPLHDFDQNRIWCAVVALACDLLAWLQTLALVDDAARRWEPKRLRLRLLWTAGRLVSSGRRIVLHLSGSGKWSALLTTALTRLRDLPAPGG